MNLIPEADKADNPGRFTLDAGQLARWRAIWGDPESRGAIESMLGQFARARVAELCNTRKDDAFWIVQGALKTVQVIANMMAETAEPQRPPKANHPVDTRGLS